MRRFLKKHLFLPLAYYTAVALAWKQPALAARAFRFGTLLRYGYVTVWDNDGWSVEEAVDNSSASSQAN